MMMMTNPITPPLELLDLVSSGAEAEIAKKILQWAAPILRQQGADEELAACVNWLDDTDCEDPQEVAQRLRASRRPNPPSLKEQALGALAAIEGDFNTVGDRAATIRRALEALPND